LIQRYYTGLFGYLNLVDSTRILLFWLTCDIGKSRWYPAYRHWRHWEVKILGLFYKERRKRQLIAG